MNQNNNTPATTTLSADQAELNALRGWLIMAASALIGLGVVLIYSASAIRSAQAGFSTFYYVEKQVVWIAISVVVMLLCSRIDYHYLEKLRWGFLLLALGLLAAVMIPGIGTVTNGARRWFRFGSMSIQPSEAVKILMVVVTAAFLSRMGKKLTKSFFSFIIAALLPLSAAAMIAIEPD
ncbi:MAG: FtsW/RodA/SpoVE family cell cycle protein, partial [Planctomycetes bacterium]|nr:FtsW/RodA/SpoVE family cell cycle protein [Planctomycetota bacterium]